MGRASPLTSLRCAITPGLTTGAHLFRSLDPDLETKLRPHVARKGLIRRDRVLELMRSEAEQPVLAVVAPPGYGKTTILSQYQADQSHPSAWLTLDVTDNDPVILLGDLTASLSAAGLLAESADIRVGGASSEILTVGVPLLAAALDQHRRGILFLDQVDHLESQSALDVVGALMMTQVIGPIQVVIAARSAHGLPFALLRSRGELVEITTTDLAMDESEAASLFSSVGLDAGDHLAGIVERTEGWPAGLYLTAIAMKTGAPSPVAKGIEGNHVFLADYLREELLGRTSESTMSFLKRTSILTQLSGPLCDFVLDMPGSAATLAELEQANLLIVPMDRTRTWYRYHSLLRDYLQSELDRDEPELEATLHSRAAEWFETNGHPDLAIEHLQSAGEIDRFATMVEQAAQRVYAEGRVETLSGWLQTLEDSKALFDHPELAALGAFARGLDGDAHGSERLADVAFSDQEGHARDMTTQGPFAHLLLSFRVVRGPEQAREDARLALSAFGTRQEWIPVSLGAAAMATIAIDGIGAAEDIWTDGLWRSESAEAHPFICYAMAQRALVAIERAEWDIAESWVEEALGRIETRRLDKYVTSGLAFAVAGRLSARAGDIPAARGYLARAAGVRPRLTPAMPLLSVQNLNELARALIGVADVAGARRVVRDAGDIVTIRPKLGLMASEQQAIKERLAEMPAGSVGASSLTAAELRLLPLLVTHLTYPEIGERLFVSRHTVKTQAMSIYRKLGVSSRTGAVEMARDAGLISL